MQIVGDFFHAFESDLADVQQAIFAGQQIDECAEIQNLGDRAFVDLAHFDFSGDLGDALLGKFCFLSIGGGDGDRAIFANVNRAAGFFGEATNRCAAFADHITNLLGIDLHGVQAGRKVAHFGVGHSHRFLHFAQNVHAGFFGLGESHLHDFFGNALNFDVHLQSGDAIGGARDFEVHIAEVIFIAQDVGQHGKTVAFFDEAHGNTCHMRFHRHASVHQGEATAANGGH